MSFVLTGFRQDLGFRVFAFERKDAAPGRIEFTVKADLGLIRRYDIRVQELPLLCRTLLERSETSEGARAMIFTEDEMRACADSRTAAKNEAARKRKAPKWSSTGERPGAAWRG
jgi:hypothetical protein